MFNLCKKIRLLYEHLFWLRGRDREEMWTNKQKVHSMRLRWCDSKVTVDKKLDGPVQCDKERERVR